MRVCSVLVILVVVTTAALLVFSDRDLATPRARGPLSQEAYVWQRSWNDAVRTAIGQPSQPRIESLTVLAAEVTWDGNQMNTTRAAIDYRFLAENGIGTGVALRIGAFRGDFSPTAPPARGLIALSQSLVKQAQALGVHPRELQLDFDCPESKLRGYRQWLTAIRDALRPMPVTITALPTWLKAPGFRELVQASDGYVLQVHSLERPKSIDTPLTLCDPHAARTAVERAAKFGIPFRVALPTYGYTIGFDPDGRFIGLYAEGPSAHWPPDTRIRVVRPDAPALAQLIADWTQDHPAALKGLIWYRLPVATDRLNWTWPTLRSVMAGRAPHAKIQATVNRPEAQLLELQLTNSGDADGTVPAIVTIKCPSARVLAADGQSGFEVITSNPPAGGTVTFSPRATLQDATLAPGETKLIGWIRLERDTEVEVHVSCNPPP